ncbi:MAG: hypothetical protein LAN37_05870 [Acidobacteriia bacterium]|nr:hypothetical protein [Terriglobia bacterium]
MRPQTLLVLLLLVAALASAQRLRRDPLTEAEADHLREVAQEPEKRIKLIIKFAQARLEAIEQLRGDPKMAEGRGKKIHDLLEDFTVIVDELDDNVDMYAKRKDDISKSLGEVIIADGAFQSRLQALRDAAQSDARNAQESKDYQYVLENAFEAVKSSEQDAQDLLREIAKAKQEAKNKGKEKSKD